MPPDPDAELMARLREGDGPALGELYERWAPRVLRYLLRVLGRGRSAWAEDCLQETFLRLRRYAGSYDPARPLAGWLFGIAHREALGVHRREALRLWTPHPPAAGESPAVDGILEEALEKLPAEVRSALILVHLEGMTREEAARIMGLSERNIQTLCHEGFVSLREILKKG